MDVYALFGQFHDKAWGYLHGTKGASSTHHDYDVETDQILKFFNILL